MPPVAPGQARVKPPAVLDPLGGRGLSSHHPRRPLHATKGGAVPQEDGPYSAAWRRYRLWSWAFWIVFVGYLPNMAFVGRVMGGADWSRGGPPPLRGAVDPPPPTRR